jgi:hypothetical protein
MMRRPLLLVMTVTVLFAGTVRARDQEKVLWQNVALEPLLTLASAAVQGKLHGWKDWKRCLRIGAASGAAFYGSKKLVGDGHVIEGLILANVASSMTSNAAAGRHALSRIGVTFGPVRAEVSTPKEKERPALIHLSTSVAELISLGIMWERSDDITVRDGLISFRRDTRYPDLRDANAKFGAYTIGVFPGLSPDANAKGWSHEVVHVIQSMQADALEPGRCEWGKFDCRTPPPSDKWLELEPLRLGVFSGTIAGVVTLGRDYDRRWSEIEAYRLADDCKVVGLNCEHVTRPRP